MTEDEAKTKWCPFSRVANGTQATNCTINHAYNQGGDAPDVFCIGSACMAWRWSAAVTTFLPSGLLPSGDGWRRVGDPTPGPGGGMGQRFERDQSATPGFCGLAGAPA